MLANEKDYVATRVAHKLGLTGPAISLYTACSTSLVAIARAWYALMSWQCDVALAGGVNIAVPQESGYLPAEGAIESADGHCRPFDADASGTVFSSGAGVVVLKRLRRRDRARRHDLGGHPRRRRQQRRRRQGQLQRAERARPVRRDPPRAVQRRCRRGLDWLRRGARHRHAARRSDRGRSAGARVRRRARRRRAAHLLDRFAQGQPRPSGRRVRRDRTDQGDAGAASRPHPGEPALPHAESGNRFRRHAVQGRAARQGVAAQGRAAPRRRQLVRRRRHQRPRRARGGAAARAVLGRPRGHAADAVRARRRGAAAARGRTRRRDWPRTPTPISPTSARRSRSAARRWPRAAWWSRARSRRHASACAPGHRARAAAEAGVPVPGAGFAARRHGARAGSRPSRCSANISNAAARSPRAHLGLDLRGNPAVRRRGRRTPTRSWPRRAARSRRCSPSSTRWRAGGSRSAWSPTR